MEIRGKRGKKKNKGFSLKDPNKNGTYYIVVWFKDSYDYTPIKKRREQAKNENLPEETRKRLKNYSRIGKWVSLGRYGRQETHDKLFEHLIDQYGSCNEQEVLQNLKEDFEELERKREEREKEEYVSLMNKIKKVMKEKELNGEIPEDLKRLRKLYKMVTR